MPCACNAGKKSASSKFTVLNSNGSKYKVYTNKTEAEAAAKRVGGKVVPG